MATERKSTGASALVDIMREIYDTKKRMKAVIQKYIETNSDDFEEYATLAHNAIVGGYNKGIAKGYADGWHVIFPSAAITPDMYEEYYMEYETFTPSIPTYSTETDVDNLIVVMKDNKRCRLLLKDALNTNSNEFVTYPDILDEQAENSYENGYNTAYEIALNKAIDLTYGTPSIVFVGNSGNNRVAIIPHTELTDYKIYWWENDNTAEKHEYIDGFVLDHSTTINASISANNRFGPVAKKYCSILDYSSNDMKYVTEVRLPAGQLSAKFTATARYTNDGYIVEMASEGLYSYDLETWDELPVTTTHTITNASDWAGQCAQKTFTLTKENPVVYFKMPNLVYSITGFFTFNSGVEYDVVAQDTFVSGGVTYTYYIANEVTINNPTAVDIGGCLIGRKQNNYNLSRNYGLATLKINSAKYAYGLNADVFVGNNYGGPVIGPDIVVSNRLTQFPNTINETQLKLNLTDMFKTGRNLEEIVYIGIYGSNAIYTRWMSDVTTYGRLITTYTGWTVGGSGIPAAWDLDIIPYEWYIEDYTQAGEITDVEQELNDYYFSFNSQYAARPSLYFALVDGTIYDNSFAPDATTDGKDVLFYGVKDNYRTNLYSDTVLWYYITMTQTNDWVTLTSGIQGNIYYYINDDSSHPILYEGIFMLDEDCTIHVYVPNNRINTFQYTATDWSTKDGLYICALEDGEITVNQSTASPVTTETYSVTKGQYLHFSNIYYRTITSSFIVNTTTKHDIMGNMSNIDDSDSASLYIRFKNDIGLVSAKKLYFGNKGKGYNQMFYGCVNLLYAPVLPATTLSGSYRDMFYGCTSLVTAPVLPATTLLEGCYSNMFNGCTSLVTAPALPATTLVEGCYNQMFEGCTSLVNAPELPATSLPDYSNYAGCYQAMFNGCTSLVTAPALPATTLKRSCYQNMFKGCTSLVNAPVISATTLATECCCNMFEGCTSLVTAPELPATTLDGKCYFEMFKGCTSLVNASALPATTLVQYCYQNMFYGCTSLRNAPIISATTLANYCCRSMFEGCTSLVTAPALSATSLSDGCYIAMFKDCTSLVVAPELPATNLYSACYSNMFYGCTSLTTVPAFPVNARVYMYCCLSMFEGCTSLVNAPALPASNTVFGYTGCYKQMFKGCTSLVNAPELPATSLSEECYYQMFYGCTSLVNAPELPAPTFAKECYVEMFKGCTNLSYIKCIGSLRTTNYSTTNWVEGVSATGLFIKGPDAYWSTTEIYSGIPLGWTVEEAA